MCWRILVAFISDIKALSELLILSHSQRQQGEAKSGSAMRYLSCLPVLPGQFRVLSHRAKV